MKIYDFCLTGVSVFMDWDTLIQASSVCKQWYRVLKGEGSRSAAGKMSLRFAAHRSQHECIAYKSSAVCDIRDRVLQEWKTDKTDDDFWQLEAFHNTFIVEPSSYRSPFRFSRFTNNNETTPTDVQFHEDNDECYQVIVLSSTYLCLLREDDDHDTFQFINIHDHSLHPWPDTLPSLRAHVKWITVDSHSGNFYLNLHALPHSLYIIDAHTLQTHPHQPIRLQKKSSFNKFFVNSHPSVNLCYAWTKTNSILTYHLVNGLLLQIIQVSAFDLWCQHPHQPHLFLYSHKQHRITRLQYQRQGIRGCTLSYHRLPPELKSKISASEHLHCNDDNHLYLTYFSSQQQPYRILITSFALAQDAAKKKSV